MIVKRRRTLPTLPGVRLRMTVKETGEVFEVTGDLASLIQNVTEQVAWLIDHYLVEQGQVVTVERTFVFNGMLDL